MFDCRSIEVDSGKIRAFAENYARYITSTLQQQQATYTALNRGLQNYQVYPDSSDYASSSSYAPLHKVL